MLNAADRKFQTIDVHWLDWHPKSREFTAEISALYKGHGVTLADEMIVYNLDTGNCRLFRAASIDRSPEGEALAWHYTCPTDTMDLIIFND